MADCPTPRSLLNVKRIRVNRTSSVREAEASRPGIPFGEDVFQSILMLERRRAERSRRPFMLLLLHSDKTQIAGAVLQQSLSTLVANTRESDLIGWYRNFVTVGIIFTEFADGDRVAVAANLLRKIEFALLEALGKEAVEKLAISVHLFPEEWDKEDSSWVSDSKLYPELEPRIAKKHLHLALKRAIDIIGSAVLLLVTLPLMAVIALLIKLTSKGPVLFKQERLGQFGARFACLKFRTMYTNCDPKIHQQYVQQFIAGNVATATDGSSEKKLYKIASDPRVTPIGRILRKSSLDEFPQFWNVLIGNMSLVGPRPPVPYEFEIYDVWHRRRVFELKPGVTGLWQVSGRNRTRFDEMVRLDLRYSQKWSLWLDFKILVATPFALFSSDCA